MPHPQQKTPEPTAELPNPELNPLLNPTLGRNLGRWAEVYFTSPPDKREEAVGELLRELKAEPIPAGAESEADTQANDAGPQRETVEILTSAPGLQCAECGHSYINLQRFCGMCGAPLAADQTGPEDYRLEDEVAPESPRAHEFVFVQPPDFATKEAPPITRQAPLNESSEITWLREKNLEAEAVDSSLGRVSKYAPAVVAVVAVGILIYAQSRPRTSQPAASAARTSASTSQATPPVPQEPSSSPTPEPTNFRSNAAPAASNSTAQAPTPKQTFDDRAAPVSPAPETKSQAEAASAAVPQPEGNASSSTNGSQELALAMDYLNGKRGPRDSAEAAKFLWKAVGKENPSAVLLLSDMYLIGDGVPKSCDQARLLLNAATRKNVPQAAQKLRDLLTSGCP